MPDILPFRAIHYPWGSDFSRLTAPPYDVISPEEREALKASDEHNVIHVTLGGDHLSDDGQKYEAAAALWRNWLESGALVQDAEPQFYLYGMTYPVGRERRTTLGLLASLKLEEFGSGEIYPHERTIPGPIQDRLKLMRTTEANLEPLWFFASSRLQGLRSIMETTMSAPPLARVEDAAGVGHSLWAVPPPQAAGIVESVARTPLVIADGHHRYETALAYREERRSADGPGPWDETLALIVDPVDYPALLKPIHRLTQGVSVGQIAELAAAAFEEVDLRDSSPETGSGGSPEAGSGGSPGPASGGLAQTGVAPGASVPLERVHGDLPEVLKMVEEEGPGTIGVVTVGAAWIMRNNAELDTVFLQDKLIEASGAAVKYEHDPEQVAAMLDEGIVAFLLSAAPIDLVAQKALAGERMPPKTTLFWPKPRTGFVMRDLSGP